MKADAGARRLLTLSRALKLLARHYAAPAPPPTADPFELILLENVAYLAAPARRNEAFAQLRSVVGTNPTAILAARPQELECITARGILKGTSAAKLRECARIAVVNFDGDLSPVVRQPLEDAVRALRSFPGIGEPGAEKVLLFAGRQALLAPDSNALRVLVRLGLAREETSYAKTYAAGRAAAQALPAKVPVMQEAHLLLQEHGRMLCKRTSPHCEACPLALGCAYARDGSGSQAGVRPGARSPRA